MAEEFFCPVCERHGLLPDSVCCPQCDADLTCFQDLDRLRAKCAVTVTKDYAEAVPPKRFARIAMFACVFSGVIALVALSFLMWRIDGHLAGMDKIRAVATHDNRLQQDINTSRLHINELEINYRKSIFQLQKAVKDTAAEIEHTDARITNLEEGLDKHIAAVVSKEINRTNSNPPAAFSEMTAPASSANTFLYYARNTDTLWSIARRFYGDGKYYPIIMEQNPHLVISEIAAGRKIQLLSSPHPAMLATLYNRKTEWINGRLLWRYVVQPGETRDSIYARFAAPGMPDQIIFDTEAKIVPFETIRVILR